MDKKYKYFLILYSLFLFTSIQNVLVAHLALRFPWILRERIPSSLLRITEFHRSIWSIRSAVDVKSWHFLVKELFLPFLVVIFLKYWVMRNERKNCELDKSSERELKNHHKKDGKDGSHELEANTED